MSKARGNSQLLEPATRERTSVRLLFVLSSLFFGISITEACSVHLLPLTLHRFTKDPLIISLILAINPAFGFVAQPLVGVWSDQIWTRVGRRAFFLIICAPLTALTLVGIPFATTLVEIVLLVVALQFFQDMLNGSDQPLLADLVPQEQRTFVFGTVKTFENLGFLLVLFLGMSWVTEHQQTHQGTHFGLPLYASAAICQILFVMLTAFFLGEKPVEHLPRSRLTLVRYFRDFIGAPMLVRLSFALFIWAFTRTAVAGWVVLYATQTLHFKENQYGNSWGWMPFVSLLLEIPLGLAAEKFAKHRVLQIAFLVIILACCIGYSSNTPLGLTLAAFLFGFGDMLLSVTHKAFISEHYTHDIIGQLAGAVNIFYATGRTISLIFVGFCVKAINAPNAQPIDYSVIWIISSFSALTGIIILFAVRDYRYESQKAKGVTSF